MTDEIHLTEDERQMLADGSLSTERAAVVEEHLRRCDACAADVARIERFMNRVSANPHADAPIDELWSPIRARIEHAKVIALAPAPAATSRRTPWWPAIAGVAAAAVIAFVVWRDRAAAPAANVVAATDSQPWRAVADSTPIYESEAQDLLNRFELQRAVMRPEAAASVAADLKVIDQAIDELKLAIATDPRNPALRQLLASSYRQKVELLKRVDNAS